MPQNEAAVISRPEWRRAPRREPERANAALLLRRRHGLGAAMLLLTLIPAYLVSRPGRSSNIARAEIDGGVAMVAQRNAGEAEEAVTPNISVVEIDAHIREVAKRHGLSPLLVAAVVEAESEFNPRAVSRKGAQGLMQLMPDTAADLQVADPFDPLENIEGGVRHLRGLMDRFDGNLPVVLAAYNAGETAVLAHRGVPPYRETRRYVARILRRIGRADLVPAAPHSARAVPVQTARPRPGSRRVTAQASQPAARPKGAPPSRGAAPAPNRVRSGAAQPGTTQWAATSGHRNAPSATPVGQRSERAASRGVEFRPGTVLLETQGP